LQRRALEREAIADEFDLAASSFIKNGAHGRAEFLQEVSKRHRAMAAKLRLYADLEEHWHGERG